MFEPIEPTPLSVAATKEPAHPGPQFRFVIFDGYVGIGRPRPPDSPRRRGPK